MSCRKILADGRRSIRCPRHVSQSERQLAHRESDNSCPILPFTSKTNEATIPKAVDRDGSKDALEASGGTFLSTRDKDPYHDNISTFSKAAFSFFLLFVIWTQAAVSDLSEMTPGNSFQPVLGDSSIQDPSK